MAFLLIAKQPHEAANDDGQKHKENHRMHNEKKNTNCTDGGYNGGDQLLIVVLLWRWQLRLPLRPRFVVQEFVAHYLDQLQRIRDRYKITIREAIADRGYGSAAIIRALQTQGVETYLPLWSGRAGNGKYLKSGLMYEIEHDRFRCPQGKYLTPNPAISENHKRYVSSPEDCRVCPQAATCPAKNRPTSHQRFVLRSLDQDLFEQVQSMMREPQFGKKLSE